MRERQIGGIGLMNCMLEGTEINISLLILIENKLAWPYMFFIAAKLTFFIHYTMHELKVKILCTWYFNP